MYNESSAIYLEQSPRYPSSAGAGSGGRGGGGEEGREEGRAGGEEGREEWLLLPSSTGRAGTLFGAGTLSIPPPAPPLLKPGGRKYSKHLLVC